MHEPNHSHHAEHDLLVIAALADRDATGEEAERAREQIAACTACAAVHADLLALAAATRLLPALERTRDFRLRETDAQRLRPNRIRRLLGSFGTARDGISRPLAMGLTTLGLAGLLIGVIPGTLTLGGAGSGADRAASEMQQRAPGSSPADADAGQPAAEAAPTDQRQQYNGAYRPQPPALGAGALEAEDAAGTVAIAGQPDSLMSVAEDETGVSQLVVISGTMLIVGLGLFLLRWTSRRFGG